MTPVAASSRRAKRARRSCGPPGACLLIAATRPRRSPRSRRKLEWQSTLSTRRLARSPNSSENSLTAISGTDVEVPALERDYVRAINSAASAEDKLDLYAAAVTSIQGRLAPLFLVMREAAAANTAVARLSAEIWVGAQPTCASWPQTTPNRATTSRHIRRSDRRHHLVYERGRVLHAAGQQARLATRTVPVLPRRRMETTPAGVSARQSVGTHAPKDDRSQQALAAALPAPNRGIVAGPNLDRSSRVVATETHARFRMAPFLVAATAAVKNVGRRFRSPRSAVRNFYFRSSPVILDRPAPSGLPAFDRLVLLLLPECKDFAMAVVVETLIPLASKSLFDQIEVTISTAGGIGRAARRSYVALRSPFRRWVSAVRDLEKHRGHAALLRSSPPADVR